MDDVLASAWAERSAKERAAALEVSDPVLAGHVALAMRTLWSAELQARHAGVKGPVHPFDATQLPLLSALQLDTGPGGEQPPSIRWPWGFCEDPSTLVVALRASQGGARPSSRPRPLPPARWQQLLQPPAKSWVDLEWQMSRLVEQLVLRACSGRTGGKGSGALAAAAAGSAGSPCAAAAAAQPDAAMSEDSGLDDGGPGQSRGGSAARALKRTRQRERRRMGKALARGDAETAAAAVAHLEGLAAAMPPAAVAGATAAAAAATATGAPAVAAGTSRAAAGAGAGTASAAAGLHRRPVAAVAGAGAASALTGIAAVRAPGRGIGAAAPVPHATDGGGVLAAMAAGLRLAAAAVPAEDQLDEGNVLAVLRAQLAPEPLRPSNAPRPLAPASAESAGAVAQRRAGEGAAAVPNGAPAAAPPPRAATGGAALPVSAGASPSRAVPAASAPSRASPTASAIAKAAAASTAAAEAEAVKAAASAAAAAAAAADDDDEAGGSAERGSINLAGFDGSSWVPGPGGRGRGFGPQEPHHGVGFGIGRGRPLAPPPGLQGLHLSRPQRIPGGLSRTWMPGPPIPELEEADEGSIKNSPEWLPWGDPEAQGTPTWLPPLELPAVALGGQVPIADLGLDAAAGIVSESAASTPIWSRQSKASYSHTPVDWGRTPSLGATPPESPLLRATSEVPRHSRSGSPDHGHPVVIPMYVTVPLAMAHSCPHCGKHFALPPEPGRKDST